MNQIEELKMELGAMNAVCQKSGTTVRNLMHHQAYDGGINPHGCDFSESKANIMLAFRHLQDASDKLHRAQSALGGGAP